LSKYRLFSWEHSYFSGKVRAFLRYKQHFGDLGPGFDDILATPELIMGLLIPATGSNVVPQVTTPDGEWLQDSSEIIDVIDARHPGTPVIPGVDRPRQRLAVHLIELLADEWMVVYGFWERWFYSLAAVTPNHGAFNAQQWGAFMNPSLTGQARRDLAQTMFQQNMSIEAPGEAVQGPYSGLVELGMTERTRAAWTASNERLLSLLETHFDEHDYVLGGRPSLADFGLLGPLYAHLYRDPVPGFELRTHYPLVSEWVERTNGTNALNARSYNQQLYSLGEDGALIGRPATSHDGEWLPEDDIPASLLPVLGVFFDEMWPMLKSTMTTLRAYFDSDGFEAGGEVAGKTFLATQGFEALQRGGGPLTHTFEIGGVRERRMVLPYHVWMLQRLAGAIDFDHPSVATLLAALPNGSELASLDALLDGCRVRKDGGRLFEDAVNNTRNDA
jgi:glutathione S-transferase